MVLTTKRAKLQQFEIHCSICWLHLHFHNVIKSGFAASSSELLKKMLNFQFFWSSKPCSGILHFLGFFLLLIPLADKSQLFSSDTASWHCKHSLLSAQFHQNPTPCHYVCLTTISHKPQKRFWGLKQLECLPKRCTENERVCNGSCSAGCLQIPHVQKPQESKVVGDSCNKAAGGASGLACLCTER